MSGLDGTPAEGQAGAGGSGPETGGWGAGLCSLSCLLTLHSGFPEILEVDGGASLGGEAGDADLDYEIVDRAGERAPPPASAAPSSPGLGRTGQGRGSSGRPSVSPGAEQSAVAVTSP